MRTRWREAQLRRAAIDQQKVEREQRFDLARKAQAAAREALDTVETEARFHPGHRASPEIWPD